MPQIEIIARIHSPFGEKFGVPRQSGLIDTPATIVFEPEYRNPDAVRGLDGFSHIWLIWQFHQAVRQTWSPTVRPPRLGGNERMGVFATRSPFRPNAMGLSSVRLEKIEMDSELGPVLHIVGADLVDGTPIFDIKPYLPYCDSHSDAIGGWTQGASQRHMKVFVPENIRETMSEQLIHNIMQVLAEDPRPRYQNDPTRVYGMDYDGYQVKFVVEDDVVTVQEIIQ